MTEAALTVLGAKPDQPFALFIEAGDVDFALHANNLDNAIGAIYSGEEAVRSVIRWVESHSNWDDSVLIVSSDHGHYLVVDDPQALAGARVRSQLLERVAHREENHDHETRQAGGEAGVRLAYQAQARSEASHQRDKGVPQGKRAR